MRKFERFIIYPMLFIAIFFSFTNDGVQQTTAQQVYDEIIAKKITVVNEIGEELITLHKGKSMGGRIDMYTSSSALLGNKKKSDPDDGLDEKHISIVTNFNGGMIKTFSGENITSLLGGGEKARLSIYSDKKIKGKQNIKTYINSNGVFKFNDKGNITIGIGTTASDENGQGKGHGLINIYDKYGEDYRSYTYK